MRPSQTDSFGSMRNDREQRHLRSQDLSPNTLAAVNTRRFRNEDSWIEIASRPSTSSLSSINNEVITTGLQVRSRSDIQSRQAQIETTRPRAASIAGSSQDEYDESESESERIMGSSNEDIEAGKDDDDTATALGVGRAEHVFTPLPHAFSHPPPTQTRLSLDSYFPPVDQIPMQAPRHYSDPDPQFHTRRRGQRTIQPDHDAALRASLTTLLSCAAAVGPKGEERQTTTRQPHHPTSLRLVPESELEGPRSGSSKQKRKSREASKERHAKKIRPVKHVVVTEDPNSSLYMWMISAGVVLVFSAISFSAGYAWGKEVGRIEGEMGVSSSCGREAIRGSGLKRLRWTAGTSSVRA